MAKKQKKAEPSSEEAKLKENEVTHDVDVSIKDEYAPIKKDFIRIVDRGLKSFQEETKGRQIEHIILRLQGRHGIIVETTPEGLISMPQMSGIEVDNQGREHIQRMFLGMNCSTYTKDKGFVAANLLRPSRTTAKEFEINAAAHEILKLSAEKSQTRGEKIQKKIDEEGYRHYKRFSKAKCETLSVGAPQAESIPVDEIFNLVSMARQILRKGLGKKLKTCKIAYYSIYDTQELADSTNGSADTVIQRTAFVIQAKTDKGNKIFKTIRGTGGIEALKRYDPDLELQDIIKKLAEKTIKECIDTDRARSANILKGEAYVLMAPAVTGVLAHEAIGHCTEQDIIIENMHNDHAEVSLKGRLGSQVSENPNFNMIDDGHCSVVCGNRVMKHCFGGIILDDDGCPGKRTLLVKDGIQQLTLNSASTFEEVADGLPKKAREVIEEHGLTGNFRSQKYDMPPLIRMTNTFILPDEDGPDTLEALASEVPSNKKGVLLVSCSGGWVDPDSGEFQITGSLGYLIENGAITDKPIKDIIVRGNITKFGRKVKKIGSSKTIDTTFSAWCGKSNQWVPVDGGGPALLVEDATIGEKPSSFTDWESLYKEYNRQHQEVACSRRRPEEIYLRIIEDLSSQKVAKQSRLCLVTAYMSIDDEICLLSGKDLNLAGYNLGDDGNIMENDDA